MSAHTAGPWGLHVYPYDLPQRESGLAVVIGDASAAYVVGASESERLANARLIAAAPDLLAACEALVASTTQAAMMEANDLARAAIEKARR